MEAKYIKGEDVIYKGTLSGWSAEYTVTRSWYNSVTGWMYNLGTMSHPIPEVNLRKKYKGCGQTYRELIDVLKENKPHLGEVPYVPPRNKR
jgi:hypothetical protein